METSEFDWGSITQHLQHRGTRKRDSSKTTGRSQDKVSHYKAILTVSIAFSLKPNVAHVPYIFVEYLMQASLTQTLPPGKLSLRPLV